MREWKYVAQCDEIPLREGRRVRFGDQEAALFNLGDEFIAVENRCPHRQGPLADGIVSGKAVFCPLHAWKIDLESGSVTSGGEGCVKRFLTKVVDNKVYISGVRLQA